MTDIDNMDIYAYWRIRAWSHNKGKPDDEPVYIDDIFDIGGG